MFTIEKIKAVPNPAIPQWRVYDQDRSLTLSVRILKSNPRVVEPVRRAVGQRKVDADRGPRGTGEPGPGILRSRGLDRAGGAEDREPGPGRHV